MGVPSGVVAVDFREFEPVVELPRPLCYLYAAVLAAAEAMLNLHDGVLVGESPIDSGSAKAVLDRLTSGMLSV